MPQTVPDPEEAARTGLSDRPDQELPLIAAHWLAEGFDSTKLRDLAGLTRRDGTEARRALKAALRSIGFEIETDTLPWDQAAWRGYWDQIRWAIQEMDHKLSPYASAQTVIEVLNDVPDLWEPGRGSELVALVGVWDRLVDDRSRVEIAIRRQLQSMSEGQVPPPGTR